MGHRTEHHALVEPKQVCCAQHDAQRAPGGPGFAHLKRALQNGELSDEAVQQWHAEGTQADDQIDGGEIRHRRRQAAEV